MHVSDELWAEIQQAVDAKLANYKAATAERGMPDTFARKMHETETVSVIIAEHTMEYGARRNALARDKASGHSSRPPSRGKTSA